MIREKISQFQVVHFLVLCPLLVLIPTLAFAAPGAHVHWTHTDVSGESRTGIPLGGGSVTISSPVVAEIDGDALNGLETAVGGADGILHVLRADGSLLWQAALPNATCSKAGPTNKLLSSPAVGELFGDGIPYVVVGYGGVGGGECGGGVVAFRGPDGQRRWHLDLKRFAKKQKFWAALHSVFSSPALADTNGNGKLEIGFGSFDRNVYLVNARGKVIWYYQAADTVWSSPSFVNIDSTPELEMIIGTDISGNSAIQPPTKDGGYVYALRTKKVRSRTLRLKKKKKKKKKKKRRGITKYNFRDDRVVIWQTAFNQTIFSTPVIADVFPGNNQLEVVIGSGCFFPQGSDNKRGKWVKILRLKDGEVIQTLNTTACLSSTPAVGDIDEDGELEIVATVNGHSSMGGDGQSRIMAWNPQESEPFWETVPRHNGSTDSFGAHFQSPVIADVDQNGSLEVLVANSKGIGIYAGASGEPLHCYSSGCPNDNPKFGTRGILRSTPAVADLNGDGELEVVIAGDGPGSSGGAYAWTNFTTELSSNAGSLTPGLLPWPMFRGNQWHNGVHQLP